MSKALQKTGLEITFLTEAAEQLGLAPKKIKAALKRAARLWSTQVLKSARAKAPQLKKFIKVKGKRIPQLGSSGALKKSLGSKIFANRKNGNITVFVGPRTKISIDTINPRNGLIYRTTPTRYAHLVENGFLANLWGSGVRKFVPGKPFLRPARDENKSLALTLTKESIESALNQEGIR